MNFKLAAYHKPRIYSQCYSVVILGCASNSRLKAMGLSASKVLTNQDNVEERRIFGHIS